jgi:hypothetical protein
MYADASLEQQVVIAGVDVAVRVIGEKSPNSTASRLGRAPARGGGIGSGGVSVCVRSAIARTNLLVTTQKGTCMLRPISLVG